MRWRNVRTASVGRLAVLSIVMAVFFQLTLLVLPAAANMPDISECTYDGKIVVESFPGANVYWQCHIVGGRRWWGIEDILDGPEIDKTTSFSASTPPYRHYVTSGVAKGYGNGVAVGSYSLRNPDDSQLVRDIGIRMIVHNRTTGGTCSDTGWIGTHSSRLTHEIAKDYPGTCGGSGYFETSTSGRFYSTSLNKWITSPWVQSGQLWLSNCCAPSNAPSNRHSPPKTDAR